MTDCERDNSPYTHTTSDDTNTPLSLQIPSTKIYFSCRDINLKADRARHSTSKFVFVPAFHSRSRSASGRVSGSLSLSQSSRLFTFTPTFTSNLLPVTLLSPSSPLHHPTKQPPLEAHADDHRYSVAASCRYPTTEYRVHHQVQHPVQHRPQDS
jgi:hypothetical protein